MGAPILTLRDPVTLQEIPLTLAASGGFNPGIVRAGGQSEEKRLLICNNFDGADGVTDAHDLTVTTYDDLSFNEVKPPVTGKWLNVRCQSLGDTEFTAVGGSVDHVIGAAGTPGVLSGAKPAGASMTLADTANYADISLRLDVPADCIDFGDHVMQTVFVYTHV